MAYSSLSYAPKKDSTYSSNVDFPELALSLQLEDKATLIFVKMAEHQKDEIFKLRKAYTKKLNDLDQALRSKCIRLYNIPETPKEDLMSTVLNILKCEMNLEVGLSNLVGCRRINSSSSPRPILVRFTSSKTMTEVMERKKYLKGTNIGICEDLCPDRAALLKRASSLFGKTNVWIDRGAIMVTLNNTAHLRFHSGAALDEFLKSRDDIFHSSL